MTTIESGCDRLLARKDGAVGWLVFNNPAKHNAISMDMAEAVPGVMRAFENDPDVRLVVLAGAGGKAFAAGSDISGFESVRADPQKNRHYNDVNERSYNAVYECIKPTIAMIRGYCIGGGLDFATSCDVRFCSDNAVFAVPAGKLGLGYGHEGILRFGRVMGFMRARDLFMSGRRMNAEEALRLGLVHRVIALAELEAETTAYAQTIADNAPLTLAALKRAFLEYEKAPAQRDLNRAQAMIDTCFKSADYAEGRAAFAAKRKPQFKGE
ncbi:MAG: Enoyl-CoA hydratase/isomerase [Betaproteobacteria bacterium]|nr:Enoyl-CoA hydratase/isomerase [Betaproteobacteria bacterium]